jgi:hypothetical protein
MVGFCDTAYHSGVKKFKVKYDSDRSQRGVGGVIEEASTCHMCDLAKIR